jgi:hypothetical protein
VHGSTRPVDAIRVAAFVIAALVAACAPTEPPPGANATPAPPSGAPSATAVSGPPVVTTADGATRIVGTGQANTPEFPLAAGTTHVSITTCSSNGVIPFVTLFDGTGGMAGFIVDAESDVKNLKAGMYHFGVSANPACTWTIVLKAA